MSSDSKRDRPLAPVGRHPYLVVVEGHSTGRAYRLILATTSVGRDPRCDIVLPYSTVSWHHASIIKRGNVIAVHDLGSRNGTFVGLDKVDRRELGAGDVIRFGDRVALELVYLELPRPG